MLCYTTLLAVQIQCAMNFTPCLQPKNTSILTLRLMVMPYCAEVGVSVKMHVSNPERRAWGRG